MPGRVVQAPGEAIWGPGGAGRGVQAIQAPAPRSQHIGTERPARNNAAPKSKNTNAPSTRVMQIVGAWPTIPDNMTELPRGTSVGLRGGQPGGCTFDRDRPYRPPHPAIWWPGQSLQPPKTHPPLHTRLPASGAWSPGSPSGEGLQETL